MFLYIDDVLSLNNFKFGDHVDASIPLSKIYSVIAMSASYLDLHLEIDREGWLRTNL